MSPSSSSALRSSSLRACPRASTASNACLRLVMPVINVFDWFDRVDGSEVTSRFQRHLDDFWAPFCRSELWLCRLRTCSYVFYRQAIHAFFTYGFAPWRVRRVSRGDYVPEIIPAGIRTHQRVFRWVLPAFEQAASSGTRRSAPWSKGRIRGFKTSQTRTGASSTGLVFFWLLQTA
jgi:hypothetical protein